MANGTTKLFDREALLPIGVVVAVVVSSVTGAMYLQSGTTQTRHEVEKLRWELEEFKRDFQVWYRAAGRDRWMRNADMRPWRDLLEAWNPELRVPPIPDPGESP